MTLRDLINGVLDAGQLQTVFTTMDETYYSDKPDQTIDRIACAYSSVLRKLLELEESTDTTGMTIELIDGLAMSDEPFIDVILQDKEGERWATDFVPWKDLIDIPVSIGNISIPTAVCYILWDITFYGFTPEVIKEQAIKLELASREEAERFDIDDLLD